MNAISQRTRGGRQTIVMSSKFAERIVRLTNIAMFVTKYLPAIVFQITFSTLVIFPLGKETSVEMVAYFVGLNVTVAVIYAIANIVNDLTEDHLDYWHYTILEPCHLIREVRAYQYDIVEGHNRVGEYRRGVRAH